MFMVKMMAFVEGRRRDDFDVMLMGPTLHEAIGRWVVCLMAAGEDIRTFTDDDLSIGFGGVVYSYQRWSGTSTH